MATMVNEYTAPSLVAEQHVHISWRAIFAGIAVALSSQVLLTLLGFAVGLTAFEPTEGAAKGVGVGFAIWLILTAIASVFLGAYFGARVAGDPWKADGVAHGVMVWAGFLLISLWMVGSGIGKLLNSAAGLAGSTANALASPELRERMVGTLGELGYSRAEAERMVNSTARQGTRETPRAPGQPVDPDTKQAAKQAADSAAAGGAVASWAAFGIALLSLAGGSIGGMLGAIGEQRQVIRRSRLVAPLGASPADRTS